MTTLVAVSRLMSICFSFGITVSPAMATDIPVNIGWAGTQPESISVQDEGGLTEFSYEASSQIFKGSISVEPRQVVVKTVLAIYKNGSVSFRLKVNSFLPSINFRLPMEKASSCTRQLVNRVAQRVDNASDAMRSILSATQLLTIPTPEDCGPLKITLVQARYDRTIQLAQLSQGLFQIDENVRQAYLNSLPQAARASALARVAIYEQQIEGLEAVQLAEQRRLAQEKGNFATAGDINDVMLARVANPELRSVYKDEGLTKSQLERDGQYLDAREASAASPNQ